MPTMLMRLARPLCCLLLTAPAWAQTPVNDDRPIDQGVEDIDPRARSQRRIDPGNAKYPTRSMIVERANPHQAGWSELGLPALDRATGAPDTHRYEYRAPGVRARMDRPDYLVVDEDGRPALNRQPVFDGAFRELPPPNTIYDLVPEDPEPVDDASNDPGWDDPRVDGRINRRLGQASDAYNPGTVRGPSAQQRRPQAQRYKIRRLHAKKYDDQPSDDPEKPDETRETKTPAETEPSAEAPDAADIPDKPHADHNAAADPAADAPADDENESSDEQK